MTPFPRWLNQFFSYLCIFVLGAFVYGSLHNHPTKLYKILLITGFGIVFYLSSEIKNENNIKK